MVSPSTNTSPNRYEPNGNDDRALGMSVAHAGLDAGVFDLYRGIAVAIESISTEKAGGEVAVSTFRHLDPGTRKALGQAERALRRAAFSLVLHAPDPPKA